MEIEVGGFQEAILEIVEVEQHAVAVELGLRIAMGEVESHGSPYLQVREFADGFHEQVLLLHGISSSCIASS